MEFSDTKLIVFSGPSGSGKSTLVNRLLRDKFLDAEFSVSAASRPPRKGETDGKHYYFLSEEAFQEKIAEGAFAEWQQVYKGNYYGTLKSEIERIRKSGKHVLFDIDAAGGMNIKRMYGSQALTVFIKPPSPEVLEERLKKRGTEAPESFKKRTKKAAYEISMAENFDCVVINDDLETAVAEVKNILQKFLH